MLKTFKKIVLYTIKQKIVLDGCKLGNPSKTFNLKVVSFGKPSKTFNLKVVFLGKPSKTFNLKVSTFAQV